MGPGWDRTRAPQICSQSGYGSVPLACEAKDTDLYPYYPPRLVWDYGSASLAFFNRPGLRPGGGGGGGTLIFLHIRRLGSFFWDQNFEFQYCFGVSEK